mmetsp:Transcript_36740/g.105880  ORF Transcript_36740/g.105880 Transcript_36740/m.105880 type:complete len:400 (-) Transcript_36740:49-1248(-)
MAGGEEFVIRLRNARKSLSAVGVHVDHSDSKTLRIDWIRPDGIFGSWNASNPSKQVLVGDRIVGVNGVRDDSMALMSMLSKQEALEVAILKGEQHTAQQGHWAELPQEAPVRKALGASGKKSAEEARQLGASVRLNNPGRSLDSLGLCVDRCAEGGALVTRVVPGGVLEAWNREHQGEPLRAGDRIVAVNGSGGGFTALVVEMERHELLDLKVQRGSAAKLEAEGAAGRQTSSAPSSKAAPGNRRPTQGRAAHLASIGAEEASGEGDENGGPRWFRVVYRPHVPARFIVLRPKVHGRFQFCQSELVEAAEVRGGWAHLARAELSRRCLPADVEVWVLINGTALGFARFLTLAPEPLDYVQDGGVIVAESLGEVHSPWDPARVVLENDRAWELLQERLGC